MKRLTFALGALMAFAGAFAQDPAEEPIITFKSNIYDNYGASNSFHFVIGTTEEVYIDVDCGSGKDEYLVTPAVYDSETQGIKGTTVTCNVGPDGIVKIYGDASLVDYFDAEGCYLDWIDLGNCTNLDILDLQHNELKHLDLSAYNKLSAIYLTGNPFTAETPLVVGTDHPNLVILEVDIIEHISPDFDITTYPELVNFDAYANHSLYHLDPSKCPKLVRLCVDSCPIRTLDVSKNTALQILNIEDSGITEIDLSNNTALTQLYMRKDSGTLNVDRKFTNIDLTHNPQLYYFTAAGNRLTSIDLTRNPLLQHLNLAGNLLTSIDVSAQTELVNFDISNNNMDFATLPLPDPAWYDYVYNQRPIVVEKSYPAGHTFDMSSKILREGTSTDAVLYAYNVAANRATALDQSYYSYENGIVTLKKECVDSVYISFGNSAFPGVRLETSMFMVKNAQDFGKPTAVLSFSPGLYDGNALSFSVGLDGAAPGNPRKFFVDPGDGSMVECTATDAGLPLVPNVSTTKKQSGAVTVYIPEGEVLTAFGTDGITLYSIELNKATELRQLSLRNAQLYSADLRYNRCLQSLDLSGNNFSSIDLSGINGVYNKNVLSDIDLSHNTLSSVVLNDTRAIHNLNLSHNNLEAFSYKEFDFIETFDLSYNKLQSINLAYMTTADRVDVSHNSLTEVMLPDEGISMRELSLTDNLFSFSDLPQMPAGTSVYHYAPQSVITLPTKAPGVNLSSQNRIIDGQGTTFVWKTTSGETLAEGTDVRVSGGQTKFLAPAVGKMVYCEMTNPAFPDFSGENVLKTSVIEAAEAPTNLIASFVSTVSGQNAELSFAAEKDGTALYIDWTGTGENLEQYVLTTSYRRFSAKTTAEARVKVYTYSPEDHISVFSISGVSMSEMDASALADATTISISNAGLSEIRLPDTDKVQELFLDGNSLGNDFDFARYTHLFSLSLNNNKLTRLDLSHSPALALVSAGDNQISEVVFGNNDNLWLLYISNNNLEHIDFTGATGIEQLDLGHNQLSALDVSPLTRLIQLLVSGNKLTFATLPPVKDSYVSYVYANQQPVDAVCVDGKVDLSSQAMVGSTPTEYAWYIGVPEFDENGELTGENLYVDDEYTIENGVSTFLSKFEGVMCVMTNPEFENLYLYTNPMDVFTTGVENIAVDEAEPVYYNLQGVRIANPTSGLYIVVRGKTVTKEVIGE